MLLTCINVGFTGLQTPNCVRQTVYDAVALDYEKVTVISDATTTAKPEVHLCECLFPLILSLYSPHYMFIASISVNRASSW